MAKTGEADINALISSLGSKDKEVCNDSFKTVLEIGGSAVRPLVKALSNENERIQLQVIRILERLKVDWTIYADNETIGSLVNSLDSKDGRIRVRARQFLVSIGPKAVPALVEALSSNDEHIRWEAAKSLGQIGDPTATQILIKALDDKVFEVRWLAAEGLASIGQPAIVPLLRRLIDEPESVSVRDGVHYVLRNMRSKEQNIKLQSVLDALEDRKSVV
jgi:HEAT repeat protein